MKNEKEARIRELFDEVHNLLVEAERLSEETGGSFYFSGPAYGMGGDLVEGEWLPSNQSC